MTDIEIKIIELKERLKNYEKLEHNHFVCGHLHSENYIINLLQEYREQLRKAVKVIEDLQIALRESNLTNK